MTPTRILLLRIFLTHLWKWSKNLFFFSFFLARWMGPLPNLQEEQPTKSHRRRKGRLNDQFTPNNIPNSPKPHPTNKTHKLHPYPLARPRPPLVRRNAQPQWHRHRCLSLSPQPHAPSALLGWRGRGLEEAPRRHKRWNRGKDPWEWLFCSLSAKTNASNSDGVYWGWGFGDTL